MVWYAAKMIDFTSIVLLLINSLNDVIKLSEDQLNTQPKRTAYPVV